MITALMSGEYAYATAGGRGTCGDCSEPVLAKCGEIVRHHWAHQPGSECVWAGAPETEWHASWKFECTDPARVEVTRGNHRADAISPSGYVLEFQHSQIDPADVKARERHWRRGAWVADGIEHYADERLEVSYHPDRRDDTYRNFVWRWSPHLLNTARWPVWVDLEPESDTILLVGKLYIDSSPRRGYGWRVDRQVFIDGVLNGYGLAPAKPSFGEIWLPKAITEAPDQGIIPAQQTPATHGTTLDWSHHRTGNGRPCVICQRPTCLRDENGRPSHKVCAEEAIDA
jgi:hypothetical protein